MAGEGHEYWFVQGMNRYDMHIHGSHVSDGRRGLTHPCSGAS
jgi:hypothetical protein